MNQTRSEISRNWQILMLVAMALQAPMYFVSDLAYLTDEADQITCAHWRIAIFAFAAIGVLTKLLAPEVLQQHWKHFVRAFAYTFYTFCIWFDRVSPDPSSSSYYIGIMLVGAGTLAFRIHREAIGHILTATFVYGAINFDRDGTIEAVFDLAIFSGLFWIIANSYERASLNLQRASEEKAIIAESVHHDWKISFLALIEIGKAIPNATAKKQATLAKLIQHTARFLYAQADTIAEPGVAKISGYDADLQEEFNSASETVRIARSSTIITRDPIPQSKVGLDKHQLFRVLLNLLSNGVEHSPDSTVTVSWLTDHENMKIIGEFSNSLPSDSQVRDIEIERIFDRHFSLGHSGRGIGLFSARRIVAEVGGILSAKIIEESMIVTLVIPSLDTDKCA